ncbi:hypothetical protein rosag_33350 [Roseisolibacter agri]|uniref:Uncharacterized protein n=1 Tax=Roseisolibacter agri TaxID=2014610 RepID=A0AA37QAN4_9BACT|nr:hypothetical protein rosag_33350 [Roseisolibacter agri]
MPDAAAATGRGGCVRVGYATDSRPDWKELRAACRVLRVGSCPRQSMPCPACPNYSRGIRMLRMSRIIRERRTALTGLDGLNGQEPDYLPCGGDVLRATRSVIRLLSV